MSYSHDIGNQVEQIVVYNLEQIVCKLESHTCIVLYKN